MEREVYEEGVGGVGLSRRNKVSAGASGGRLSPTPIPVQLEDPPPASTVRYVAWTISGGNKQKEEKDKHTHGWR